MMAEAAAAKQSRNPIPFKAALLPEGSLLEVASPKLITRYNECLERLGIPPTSLSRFHIDRSGWSSEIAVEKGDPYYLSAGVANPMAVILSPDQRDRPLLFPYNSYDGRMLAEYFERYRYEIPDITRSSAIGLDIDHELTQYETPLDLLLVEYIIVRSVPGPLSQLAGRQKQLVDRLLSDDRSWFDRELRREIVESALTHGDLRFRSTELLDWKFASFRSFYTRAFGGVFVIRPQERPPFIVLEDPSAIEGWGKISKPGCLSLSEELLPLLRSSRLVELDAASHQAEPMLLSGIREALGAELLCAHDPELHVDRLTAQQRKQLLQDMQSKLPDCFHEFERAAKRLLGGADLNWESLSIETQLLFARPVKHLQPYEKDLIEHLLLRLRPWDVANLYRLEPGRFAAEFESWPLAKRRWALSTIGELRGQPPAGRR